MNDIYEMKIRNMCSVLIETSTLFVPFVRVTKSYLNFVADFPSF